MTAVLAELITDLKVLRKGRGLFVSRIDEKVGTTLRRVCEVTDADGPAEIRHKVGERLGGWARRLPPDLRVAVMAAFAIAPDARLPLYQDRVNLAAAKLNRDPRTARRRIDDGIHHIAQLAAAFPPARPRSGEAAWHIAELRATLALDRDEPEVLEQRRIVADVDGLSEVELRVAALATGVDMFHGGTLVPVPGGGRAAFALRLPEPLRLGERHDLALRVRLGRDQHTRPYFSCVPEHPCAALDLHVRFDRRRVPDRVRTFERDLVAAGGADLRADAAGEVHASFADLVPGMAYGVRWGAARTGRVDGGAGVLAARAGDGRDQAG